MTWLRGYKRCAPIGVAFKVSTNRLILTLRRITKRTSGDGLQGHLRYPSVSDLGERIFLRTGLFGFQPIKTMTARLFGSNANSTFRLPEIGYPIISFKLVLPLLPLAQGMEPLV